MADETKTVTTPEEVDAEATEVEETTEEVAEPTEDEAEATETSTEESTEEPKEIDYKAILKAERVKREKAEKALADRKYDLNEYKRKQAEESESGEETDDDKPLTRKELAAYLAEQEQEKAKTSQADEVKRIIAANTSSEDEAEAAFLMYQNRYVPTGDPQADAMFVIGGLNVKRSQALTEELKRANESKQNVTTTTSTHNPDVKTREEPKASSQDIKAIKDAGFAWDGKKQVYTKKAGHQTMFYDPKRPEGKRRWNA